MVFADWLDDHSDPRATGYRAIAVQKRHTVNAPHGSLKREGHWWHCPGAGHDAQSHNDIPADWFALLPPKVGSTFFWPVFTPKGGVCSRRECEDALALAFTKLPP